jgi:predicted AAA+ superfamily ATPase
VLLQVLSFIHAEKKPWQVSAYRTDAGAEVDGILQTRSHLLAIECKWSPRVGEGDLRGLRSFEAVAPQPVEKYLIYTGATRQRFSQGETALSYHEFFHTVIPHLT